MIRLLIATAALLLALPAQAQEDDDAIGEILLRGTSDPSRAMGEAPPDVTPTTIIPEPGPAEAAASASQPPPPAPALAADPAAPVLAAAPPERPTAPPPATAETLNAAVASAASPPVAPAVTATSAPAAFVGAPPPSAAQVAAPAAASLAPPAPPVFARTQPWTPPGWNRPVGQSLAAPPNQRPSIGDARIAPDGPMASPELAYEGRVRSSYASAQGLQGPLDGGWVLHPVNSPQPLYRIHIVDRGDGLGLQGVWSDARRPEGALGGFGMVDAIGLDAGGLSIRFTPRRGAEPVTLILQPLVGGEWAGEVVGAEPVRVTLRRR